jgi:hypothetical protein
MKKGLLLSFILLFFAASAQKKPAIKPTKLLAKNKNQTVSVEYKDDILYFTRPDLLTFMESNNSAQYGQAHRYLNGTGNEEINFKLNDTTKFKNVGERNLYKVVLEIAPQLMAAGKTCDMVKKTHIFNLQVIIKPCEGKEAKKLITDKKGRIIFNCE